MTRVTHGTTAARAAAGARALAFFLVSYHIDYYRSYNTCQYYANNSRNYYILNKHLLLLSMNWGRDFNNFNKR